MDDLEEATLQSGANQEEGIIFEISISYLRFGRIAEDMTILGRANLEHGNKELLARARPSMAQQVVTLWSFRG